MRDPGRLLVSRPTARRAFLVPEPDWQGRIAPRSYALYIAVQDLEWLIDFDEEVARLLPFVV